MEQMKTLWKICTETALENITYQVAELSLDEHSVKSASAYLRDKTYGSVAEKTQALWKMHIAHLHYSKIFYPYFQEQIFL